MTGSILFHFTEKEGLFGILRDNFKPSFAREELKSMVTNISSQFAAPMVSFSDMRLDEVKEFNFPYGKYGIGLTKEWAVRNHLCAVMYVEENSDYLGAYTKALSDFYKYINDKESENVDLIKLLRRFLGNIRYMKPYQSTLVRKGKKLKENYCFANEREWRYVIPLSDNDISFLSVKELDSKGKEYWNKRVENERLLFTPTDIRYLIVPTDDDVIPLMQHIESVKDKYSLHDIKILQSRILTAEQIISDF